MLFQGFAPMIIKKKTVCKQREKKRTRAYRSLLGKAGHSEHQTGLTMDVSF